MLFYHEAAVAAATLDHAVTAHFFDRQLIPEPSFGCFLDTRITWKGPMLFPASRFKNPELK